MQSLSAGAYVLDSFCLILGVKARDTHQKERKQGSQHNRPNPNNSYKTKKNFTGFYTEVNPSFWSVLESSGNKFRLSVINIVQ